MNLSDITLASLLSPGGVAAAAALTFLVVALAKRNLPLVDARVSGALQATIVLLVLYIGAFVATPGTPIFTAFLFFALADAAALGVDSGVAHLAAVRKGTAGIHKWDQAPDAPRPG